MDHHTGLREGCVRKRQGKRWPNRCEFTEGCPVYQNLDRRWTLFPYRPLSPFNLHSPSPPSSSTESSATTSATKPVFSQTRRGYFFTSLAYNPSTYEHPLSYFLLFFPSTATFLPVHQFFSTRKPRRINISCKYIKRLISSFVSFILCSRDHDCYGGCILVRAGRTA